MSGCMECSDTIEEEFGIVDESKSSCCVLKLKQREDTVIIEETCECQCDSNTCPDCGSELLIQGRMEVCQSCGWQPIDY